MRGGRVLADEERRQRATADLPAPPPGWSAALDIGGLPLWRWAGGRVCVASDTDQLRYLAGALRRFDEMTAEELAAYLRR